MYTAVMLAKSLQDMRLVCMAELIILAQTILYGVSLHVLFFLLEGHLIIPWAGGFQIRIPFHLVMSRSLATMRL